MADVTEETLQQLTAVLNRVAIASERQVAVSEQLIESLQSWEKLAKKARTAPPRSSGSGSGSGGARYEVQTVRGVVEKWIPENQWGYTKLVVDGNEYSTKESEKAPASIEGCEIEIRFHEQSNTDKKGKVWLNRYIHTIDVVSAPEGGKKKAKEEKPF